MAAAVEKKVDQPRSDSEATVEADEDVNLRGGGGGVEELADLLSKLNPSAKEFIPPSRRKFNSKLSAEAAVYVSSADNISSDDHHAYMNESGNDSQPYPRRRNGRRGMNERIQRYQKEDAIKRTIYVADINQQVDEEQLALLFSLCGKVRDCRICGDPRSVLRFAFIEFQQEDGVRAALSLDGTLLGYYPMKVLPSKTAILPVNPKFLPQSEDEEEMAARTVYCTNIDRNVTQSDVKSFFWSLCGEVSRLRLLGDLVHSTRIAFVEFVQFESAVLALTCSGRVLGTRPVRVSPSKTPVRSRPPQQVEH